MMKQPWVALVCAGAVSRSGLARVPRLHEQLGWVKSNTIATASRAVNALHAGRAVRDYESLSKAEMVLIQAPDAAVPEIVDALASSGLYWPGKCVSLSHPTLDASALSALERRGACVGSCTLLCESPLRFLIEGQPLALQRLRRFFKNAQAPVIEIRYGRKNEYLGGVYTATAEFLPLFSSAVDRFIRAGMQREAASSTAASLIDASMRAYFRSGKRSVDRTSSRRALKLPA